MFFQVMVPKSQRSYLRFLQWPEGDLDQELQGYKINVHPFGASPPQVVLTLTSDRLQNDDNEKTFSPLVAETIQSTKIFMLMIVNALWKMRTLL